MRTVRLLICCLCIGAAVAGCETPPQQAEPQPVSFAALPPISLDVARIEIQRRYKPPLKLPNVEHEMPDPLLDAAERWAKDRLRAVGRYGTARLTIDQASVIEVKLEKTGGFRGAFTTDQTERYDATLAMAIEASGATGKGAAAARTTVMASRTVAEDATIAERETLWHGMTVKIMEEVNRAFEARIRRHLGMYVK